MCGTNAIGCVTKICVEIDTRRGIVICDLGPYYVFYSLTEHMYSRSRSRATNCRAHLLVTGH